MPGRKPKPIELHERNGNPSKKNLAKEKARMPRAPEASAIPPSELSEEGLDYWRRIFPVLQQMRVMTAADEIALTECCEYLADACRYRTALRRLRTGGATDLIKTKNGFAQPNPLVAMMRAASNQARKYLIEFGLTPSSRTKIHAEQPDDADDLAEFVANMN